MYYLIRFSSLLIFCFCFVIINLSYGQGSVVTGSATTSKTGYTVGEGKNRLLVVAVTGEVTSGTIGTISGITWGGQSLTQARTHVSGNVLRTDVWYLDEEGISAARGSCSYNFIVTWTSTPGNEVFASFTLEDMDQTTPVSAVNSSDQNTTTTRPTGIVAVGANDVMVYASSSANNRTHTAPGTYTEQTDQIIGGAGGTSMATATRAIGSTSNENPTATWTG